MTGYATSSARWSGCSRGATYVVGKVHRPAAEPALGAQPQIEADPVGQGRRATADEHRVQVEVQPVDDAGPQGVRREGRPTHRHVAVGRVDQPAPRPGRSAAPAGSGPW